MSDNKIIFLFVTGLIVFLLFASNFMIERYKRFLARRRLWNVLKRHPRAEDMLQILDGVLSVLGTSGENWTRFTLARSLSRVPVNVQGLQAVKFSIHGAISRVVAPESFNEQTQPFEVANRDELIINTINVLTTRVPVRYSCLNEFNDRGTWMDIWFLINDTMHALRRESQCQKP